MVSAVLERKFAGRPWWVLAILLAIAPIEARADTLLVIDISNPAGTTFVSTFALPANNDIDGTWLQEGFTLADFFAASVEDSSPVFFDSSSLASPGGAFDYTEMLSVDFEGGTNYRDLNVFGSGFSSQDFSTALPAFSGSAAVDWTDWIAVLPTIGTTGNIYSGDSDSNMYGVLLGQYVVVPEPAVPLLLVLGGWLMLRRYRVSRRARQS